MTFLHLLLGHDTSWDKSTVKDTFKSSFDQKNSEFLSPGRSATSWRAITLGFVLAIVHIVWLSALGEYWSFISPTSLTLVSTVVFIFFWLVLANRLISRRWPGRELVGGELLVIFSMMTVGCTLAGTNLVPILVHIMLEGVRGTTEPIPYTAKALAYFPEWIRISDTATVKAFFSGRSSLFADNHLQAFAGPFIWWGLAMGFFVLISVSVTTIMRRQWSRNEHLNFPVTQLPVMMSSATTGLLSNRLFQIGFSIAGGLMLINGFSVLYPFIIPKIPIDWISEVRRWGTGPYWDFMHWTPISLSPFAIGMAFTIPLDLLFSLWFFTWMWKFERMIGIALGKPVSLWSPDVGFPHHAHQMIGIWLTLLVLSLWTARHHLRGVLRQALRPGTGVDDQQEGVRYRTALIGLVVGVAGMLWFLMSLGVPFIMAIIYALMLPGFCLVVARIRAELGPPIQDLQASGPDRAVFTFAGPFVVGPKAWTALKSGVFWTNMDAAQTYPSGAHVDALRMGEVSGALNRRYWISLMLVMLVGGLLAYWSTAYLGFFREPVKGLAPAQCWAKCSWVRLTAGFEDVTPRPSWSEVGGIGVGAAITWGLFALRSWGLRLPLHPIGYLLSCGVPMSMLWFPCLVAWLIKLIILRYGGLGLYRKALPFFMGLIVGQFVVGIGWRIVGMIFSLTHGGKIMPTYSFY
jgi:hypothetical protein